MQIILTVLAVLFAFSYAFYVKAILGGHADLTERSLMASIADWLAANGVKSRRKIWIVYWSSLILEFIYLYLALNLIENAAFNLLTAVVLGVEAYVLARMHQKIWWFFHGKITLGEVFAWKIERVSAMLMFTHAVLLLLIPVLSWF